MAAASAEQFAAAAARLEAIGGRRVELDFAPFAAVAAMLYQSSFVAERYSGIRAFLEGGGKAGGGDNGAAKADADAEADDPFAAAAARQRALISDARLLPVTRAIISGAGRFTAADAFDDAARLAALRARAKAQLARTDVLLVPTALEHYLVAEVAAEEGAEPPSWPKNAKNGRFTNFVNLMGGLCGVSLPQGVLRADYAAAAAEGAANGASGSATAQRAALLAAAGGPLHVALPFGVTLLAAPWQDDWLWGVAARLEAATGLGCGPEGHGVEPVRTRQAAAAVNGAAAAAEAQ